MWNRAENKVTLTIIRHGFTRANIEKRYIGKTDQPLAKEGIEALRLLWKVLPQADMVFTSPMLRAKETAQILFPDLPAESFNVISEWAEIDFGRFEMKNYNELKTDPEYQAWIDSGGMAGFPGGEGIKKFTERTMAGFSVFFEACRREKIFFPAVVVHGGTIMALLSSLTGKNYYDFRSKPGEGYRLALTADGKIEGSIEKVPM